MPVLSEGDPLPARPARVLVAGTSGAGKTTVARQVAAVLGLPAVELDTLFHGPGWVPRPEFPADAAALAARPEWVTEWQYDAARPLLAARADLVVWVDPPRRVVLRQVVRRTVHRRLTRQQLWNGNVEGPLWRVLTDPEHIVRWAWTTAPTTAPRVLALGAQRPELPVVRLGGRAAVHRWLSGPLRQVADQAP